MTTDSISITPEFAIETFGQEAREPVTHNLSLYCDKWTNIKHQVEELERIIPTLPQGEGITLRGFYEVILPRLQRELWECERHIRYLQKCLELLEEKHLFRNPATAPGHVDTAALKDQLDIVDVIGREVQLRRAGTTFKGLCPFHSEKTPSFVVYPVTKRWWCYGACGDGGDVITFVQKIRNCGFKEAVAELRAL